MIVPHTEPFFLPGNSTGCLLIHGFTGSPTEMIPLGNYLAGQGYSVLGVRLFGHGTKLEDLNRARWEDWVHSVQDGWHILEKITEEIFLIGLSMGGVLALHQAAALPAAGVISISAPYEIGPDPRLPFLPLLALITPYISKGGSNWEYPGSDQHFFAYQKYAVRSIQELRKLIQNMQATLPNIKIPALLIHSQTDPRVAPENMDWLYQSLGTAEDQKDKLLLQKSGHVVTRDIEQELVFQEINHFIRKRSLQI